MNSSRAKAYITGPVSGMPAQIAGLRAFYEGMGELCARKGIEACLPHKITDPEADPSLSARDIYHRMVEHIATMDLIIVYAGVPSSAVGSEVELARREKLDVILVYEHEAQVSRILRGSPAVIEHVAFSDFADGLQKLDAVLDRWLAEKKDGAGGAVLTDSMVVRKLRRKEIGIVDPEGQPVIDPRSGTEREPGQLQAHGYDLRVDDLYSWQSAHWVDLSEKGRYTIRPDELVIVRTYEKLAMGKTMVATIHSLARLTLLGLSHISTTVHPGWGLDEPAALQIALRNTGDSAIPLEYKQAFCRLVFYQAAEEATRPAPTLPTVTRLFIDLAARAESQKRRRAAVGWGLVVASVVLGIGAIYLTNTYAARHSPAAIAIVAAMLPVLFAALRRRYRLM